MMSRFAKWMLGDWDWLETGQGYRKMHDLTNLVAQQHEALWALLRLDMVAINKEAVGWQHVQQLQEAGNDAIKAAEDFKEKYE